MKNRWPRRLPFDACLLVSFVLLVVTSVAAQAAATPARIVRCPIKEESPLLVNTELIDTPGFGIRLRDGQDALSRHLHTQLTPATQLLLQNLQAGSPTPELEKALVADLNRVLSGPSLFNPERFAGVGLSDELRSLMASNPHGLELVLLNRLLLEAAYPGEIAKDLNRPVPKGLTITSIKVTGRRGVGPLEKELQTLLVGKEYTPALHDQAVNKVDEALTNEVNASFETQAGIEGGAHASFLYITKCVEIDDSSKSIDVIVRVLFLRTDLRDLAANILPLPRSLQPSFYDKMPAVLRAFNPLLDFGYDRRTGPVPSLKLSTNLLALKPLVKGEETPDPGTRLDFTFSGQKALSYRFFQTSADLKLIKERPGKLIEQIDFGGAFSADDQPLSVMRQTNNGLHLSGQIKLRPRLGLLNTVYLKGGYDRTINKVFSPTGSQVMRERDNTGGFRGLVDGRFWDGFTRVGIWFESTEASKTSTSYKRLAGLAGFQKELGSGTQTIGVEAVVGAGRSWGILPLYSRFFGGNNAGNFLYDGPDTPTMSAFPVGPLLRSYGKTQATAPSSALTNSGGTSYWHANLNLAFPVQSWSSRLIPDEEVDITDPETGLSKSIKLNQMLENFTIKTATNTLTDTMMDDIIDDLMKKDPNLSEDEAEKQALPIAALRATKLVEREVAPTMRFISRHANLYAVKPMLMMDAGYLRGNAAPGRQRFGAGGGIQVVMVVARAEIGYMRSLPVFRGEAKGNFVFRLTFQNIF
jgi:hypothetical protein